MSGVNVSSPAASTISKARTFLKITLQHSFCIHTVPVSSGTYVLHTYSVIRPSAVMTFL